MHLYSVTRYCSILLLFAFLPLFSCGRVAIHQSKKSDEIIRRHRTVAIIPVDIQITRKLYAKESYEAFLNQQANESYSLQSQLEAFFNSRSNQYTVSIQKIQQTNLLLSQAGIDYKQAIKIHKPDLIGMLGVDAVLIGRIRREKVNSAGGALAAGALFGASAGRRLITDNVQIELKIYDKGFGEAVWRCLGQMNGSIITSGEYLTQFITKKLARRFPYRKKQ